MGVKQSKRSVDITETSTKGEIEGFGNEGKVEKIIDGVVEKVAVNGHVDGDLQNGIDFHQNGVEFMQNGEAATVATEKATEKKDSDASPLEGVVNGTVENGEVNGEAEKTEEAKKLDEKKEKKKDKKVVKKKFSFRNFSFSKKDKSKPPKEEKSQEKVEEMGGEEVVNSENQEMVSKTQEKVIETSKLEEPVSVTVGEAVEVLTTAVAEEIKQEVEMAPPSIEISPKIVAGSEDLPPPLPASPPPSEPIEGKLISAMDELDLSEPSSENPSGEITEVASSISCILADKMDASAAVIRETEKIVIETGKQIEEKATSLLKAVEEKVEESVRTVEEFISNKKEDVKESCQSDLGDEMEKIEKTKEEEVDVAKGNITENELAVDMSNITSLGAPKQEETTEKVNEEGAGESLADIPKDLTEEMTSAIVETADPDSLEIPAPTPPPVLESVTGE